MALPSISRPIAMNLKIALRVLLVDPNDDFRYVFALLLELMGYVVETASNGAEALDRVKMFLPDVVLTELDLEKIGGLELARQLRLLTLAKDVTLVAIASCVMPDTETIALKGGFDYFLAKPVTGEQVVTVLQLVANQKGGKQIWLH